MTQPIRIHHADDDKEVRARHERIQARLEHFGPDQVRSMMGVGGFPTEWNPIIVRWLSGDKLEAAKDEKAA